MACTYLFLIYVLKLQMVFDNLRRFLLVKLHMDSLVNHTNSSAVHSALETLPAEVNATYDIAMERITSQDDIDRKLAERVLSWITYAYRPLSLKELQHALAVSPGMTVMNSDAFEHELILTSVCAGLVVIEEGTSIVRLVRESLSSNMNMQQELIFWQTTPHRNILKPNEHLCFHMLRPALLKHVSYISLSMCLVVATALTTGR